MYTHARACVRACVCAFVYFPQPGLFILRGEKQLLVLFTVRLIIINREWVKPIWFAATFIVSGLATNEFPFFARAANQYARALRSISTTMQLKAFLGRSQSVNPGRLGASASRILDRPAVTISPHFPRFCNHRRR